MVKTNQSYLIQNDAVGSYLGLIGRDSLLTSDEEVSLAQAIQAGKDAAAEITDAPIKRRRELLEIIEKADKARTRFIEANLRLVVFVAKKYPTSTLSFSDLIQEGNIGLMYAIDRFDWKKGFKFSTYAIWWIRQAIERGIANQNRNIRIPVHAQEHIIRIRQIKRDFIDSHNRPPSIEELVQLSALTKDAVVNALKYVDDTLSLDMKLDEDSEVYLNDCIEDESAAEAFDGVLNDMMSGQVKKLLDTLNDKERQVIEKRFGFFDQDTQSLREAGEVYSLSYERIRQIEQNALSKLSHPSRGGVARELLDNYK
jgi:RNA polymerase sigma factor (sigma-70 family)